MKAINKWALAVTLLAGLSSCEMKDEILGKDPLTGDTGILSLYVETGKTTKGTTDQVDQFPVTITGTDVDFTKKFDSYAELKQAGNITLPVGTYTIEACSPGEFKSEMDEPFYGGKLENVKIVKGQTAETSVVCTMQNVKISISLTEEFLATYQDWTITVTDKKQDGHIKTYTKAADGETPAPVYWKMDEGVETIYINGTAKTNGNEDVTISGTAKKSNLPEFEEGDDIYFVGGDELKIDFNPVKVEGSTPGIEKDGIQITITLKRTKTWRFLLIRVQMVVIQKNLEQAKMVAMKEKEMKKLPLLIYLQTFRIQQVLETVNQQVLTHGSKHLRD